MRRNPAKVLVCGAFSTGKTTLVEALEATLSTAGRPITVCTDVARTCPLPLNHNQTLETSLWLAAEQMRNEIEATVGSSDLILCDRGIPDILSHHVKITPPINTSLDLAFQHFAKSWCSTYTLVLHAAIDETQPIAEDEIRVPDLTYRQALDTAIREILCAVDINPYILPFNMADRLAYATELVNNHYD